MPRNILDPRRYAESFEMNFRGMPFQVSVGYFMNCKPAEVFVSSVKSGTDLEGVSRDAAVLLSIALQYGAPIETIQGAITRTLQGDPQTVIGAIVDQLANTSPLAMPFDVRQHKPPSDPEPIGALPPNPSTPPSNEALTPPT